MKVLVVDNGGQWTHREWRVLKYIGVEAAIIPNTTPMDSIDADGLVLSGGAPRIGSELPKLGATGEYLDKLKVPMLGICVGAQFMAVHFGGEAGPAMVPEYGNATVVIEDHDQLLKGLPGQFQAWESHNDEVKRLPDGFLNLASSKDCEVQAFRHEKRPLFGVQFHPEVEHTEHGERIFRNFVETCKK